MSPILIPEKIELGESQPETFSKRQQQTALIDFRVENGDLVCPPAEMIGMLIEIKKYRESRDRRRRDEGKNFLPMGRQKSFAADDEGKKQNDYYQRRDAKRDIGVHADPEKYSGKNIIDDFLFLNSADEKKYRKNEYEREHNGSKTDPAEIDRPKRGGGDESGDDPGPPAREKLLPEQNHTKDCERPEKNRPHFEARHADPEQAEAESDKVHEQTFAPIVVFIKHFPAVIRVGRDRVHAVHRLVGIYPRRQGADMITANEQRRENHQHGQNDVCFSTDVFFFFPRPPKL